MASAKAEPRLCRLYRSGQSARYPTDPFSKRVAFRIRVIIPEPDAMVESAGPRHNVTVAGMPEENILHGQ
jgi:hypothetical protein